MYKYNLHAEARPHIHSSPTRLSPVETMVHVLDAGPKKQAEENLGDVLNVHLQGFLDIPYGAVVKSNAAMALLRMHHAFK